MRAFDEPTYLFNPASKTWHNTQLARENCNLDAVRRRIPKRRRIYAAVLPPGTRFCLRCQRAETK